MMGDLDQMTVKDKEALGVKPDYIFLRVFWIRSFISLSESEENLIPNFSQWGHFFDRPIMNSSKEMRISSPQF